MTSKILLEDMEYIHEKIHGHEKFRDGVVLVTGCAGFLGRYILEYLTRYARPLGIRKIIGLDTFLLDRPTWLERLAAESDILDIQTFDISIGDIAALPHAAEITHVVHAASIASPTFYRQYPIETIHANIWGLRRLFDACRDNQRLRGFLFFSSSEIYGDPMPEAIPTSEEYPGNVSCTGPRACYDESKRLGETMSWVYAKQWGLPVTVARPFNNYGPGMRIGDKRLPADLAKCIIENRDIVLLSDGTPTRTFCYVADAVVGYLLALLHGKYDYFNIGIDRPEIMVRSLADIFAQAGNDIFGYTGEVVYGESDDAAYLTHNPNRRCPVIDKAKQVLNYQPNILVEEGVGRYLRFLKQETTL
ncbi:MAG: NAD-dependent epimerase/dehydratase family protein [Sphingomonas sp.]|jgi:UDP-glucuronate decarboxylase